MSVILLTGGVWSGPGGSPIFRGGCLQFFGEGGVPPKFFFFKSFFPKISSGMHQHPAPLSPRRQSMCSRYTSYWNAFLLPAAMKLGQGNIFTRVCDSVNGGCGLVLGGLQFWGGSSNFGGVSPIFWGGLQFFEGGVPPNFFFFKFFFFLFSNLFFPKISSGMHQHPAPPFPQRRSMRGRYASYWNAFL